jgi:uncharacterized protein YcaQ
MPATLEELTKFHDFAAKRLASNESELTMQQLLDLWRMDNPDTEELRESVSSLKEVLQAWDQGDRGIPYEVHIRELKAQFGMADE